MKSYLLTMVILLSTINTALASALSQSEGLVLGTLAVGLVSGILALVITLLAVLTDRTPKHLA